MAWSMGGSAVGPEYDYAFAEEGHFPLIFSIDLAVPSLVHPSIITL